MKGNWLVWWRHMWWGLPPPIKISTLQSFSIWNMSFLRWTWGMTSLRNLLKMAGCRIIPSPTNSLNCCLVIFTNVIFGSQIEKTKKQASRKDNSFLKSILQLCREQHFTMLPQSAFVLANTEPRLWSVLSRCLAFTSPDSLNMSSWGLSCVFMGIPGLSCRGQLNS